MSFWKKPNYSTSSRIVFVRFFGRIEDTKKTFQNELTFSKANMFFQMQLQVMADRPPVYAVISTFSCGCMEKSASAKMFSI